MTPEQARQCQHFEHCLRYYGTLLTSGYHHSGFYDSDPQVMRDAVAELRDEYRLALFGKK